MQTTAIRTVANSLPEKGVILLTLLISDRYILFAELWNFFCATTVKRTFIFAGRTIFSLFDGVIFQKSFEVGDFIRDFQTLKGI